MTSRFFLTAVLLGLLARPAASQLDPRLYEAACEAEDMLACNMLGLMYETGDGVPQDLARAVLLYDRACEGGELAGCTNLGLMYELGLGVPPDLARAVLLFTRACDGGERLGCDNLRDLGQEGEQALAAGFFKAGMVADGETGAPLEDAIVEVASLGIRVLSDEQGRVALGRLPRGSHRLRAERVGYEILEGDLEVPGKAEFVVLLSRGVVDDPLAFGRIVGRVLDEGGSRGLSDVDVTVVSQTQARVLSNAQGRFALRRVEPGLVELRLTRLGYAPRTETLVVHPGRTVELTATLSTQPIELEPIEVDVRNTYLERNGFYQRADRGLGRQFDRGDLDEIQPLQLSDLFWRVPGVRLQYGAAGETRVVSRRSFSFTGGACPLQVYMDGMRLVGWDDIDWIDPETLEAVEVYSGVGTPIRYGGNNSCGVILLWTRQGR